MSDKSRADQALNWMFEDLMPWVLIVFIGILFILTALIVIGGVVLGIQVLISGPDDCVVVNGLEYCR